LIDNSKQPVGKMLMTDKKTTGEKSAYERKIEAKLEESTAKINTVKAQIKGATANSEIAVKKELEKAESQLDEYLANAKHKVERVKEASDDMWEELKDEVEESWEDLSQALKRVINRFSK
jgi:DNA repair exonuclease SbcCD ATPase subunit